MFELTLRCLFWDDEITIPVNLPDKWKTYYKGEEIGTCLCPKHADCLEFFKDQCPGCVGSIPDCPLFKDIYHYKITELDLKCIEDGKCPRRVSGTFFVKNDENGLDMRIIDMSTTSKGGKALAKAIREYIARRPK